jgi:hypothetical protein
MISKGINTEYSHLPKVYVKNFRRETKMLRMSNCEIRKCKHLQGILQPDGTEMSEVSYCDAFPDGIPNEIAYGNNKHLKPIKGQKNDIVFEK